MSALKVGDSVLWCVADGDLRPATVVHVDEGSGRLELSMLLRGEADDALKSPPASNHNGLFGAASGALIALVETNIASEGTDVGYWQRVSP
jgi:hypothetical protein